MMMMTTMIFVVHELHVYYRIRMLYSITHSRRSRLKFSGALTFWFAFLVILFTGK